MATTASSNSLPTLSPIVAGGKVRLDKVDTRVSADTNGERAQAATDLAELNGQLAQLQVLLYAEHKHAVLVVLQAMDTGGKDGVIRKVFTVVNPQGVRVVRFQAPTPPELAQDFLWRAHKECPAKGELVVFNRSLYEDVLITRVNGSVDDATAKRRFRQINDFEAMLVEEGTTIIKFFLHITKAEQKKRLQERLDDPSKAWKFNVNDLAQREHWDDYQQVYQDVLNNTSTPHAPWYVVPADQKWARDVMVSRVLVNTLAALKMQYPVLAPELKKLKIKD